MRTFASATVPLPWWIMLAVALAIPLATRPASAAPCAGFPDVQDTDVTCASVEWIRNRSITLGCGGGMYCPSQVVSRASMALFLNRFGTALTPQLAFVENSLGSIDPDDPAVLCATAPVAAAGYTRQALVSASFGGLAAGEVGYAARPMVSTDGGNSWSPLGTIAIRESVAGVAWTQSGSAGVHAIPAGSSVRFALDVSRESGTAGFTQGRCQLVASVTNANPVPTADLAQALATR